MNTSQHQSLDENVVFSPVLESDPEFLHSEAERCAVEQLLTAGPGAFYPKLCKERLTHFLSPEEVNHVSSWVEDYHISEVPLDDGNFEGESGTGTQRYSVQYFPIHSDIPAPCLELGWPEKERWEGVDQAEVYINPPVEQMPHIREVVRRLLQGATTLIAIVTDRVTDRAVIADLHCAASRGVPVYIILNRRSLQENFNPNRFKHPNIRVRTVGGKTFFSRDGKMVVGELKENFILVDLQTVVLGSYSLTWTDAHLHRQLITVMSGPVVESFDREFRVLYAASLPISDQWKSYSPVEFSSADEPHTLYQPQHFEPYKRRPALIEKSYSPPPPPTDCPLNWEALGVVQWNEGIPDGLDSLLGVCGMPLQCHSAGLNGQSETAGARRGAGIESGWESQVEDKLYSSVKVEPRHAADHQTTLGFTRKPDQVPYRRLSLALETEREAWDGMLRLQEHRRNMKPRDESETFSHAHRRDYPPRVDRSMEENMIPEEVPPESAAKDKRPIILRVPQTESFSSLSDILRRINAQKSGKEQQKRVAKTTISKSMLDLSAADTAQNTSWYESFPLTPALALMKKRNDEIKSGLLRPPRTFLPLSRPRSSSFALQRERWRPLFREQRSDEDM
ncbi:protein FAM83C [Pygocentrus nattereri]|uniref:protein FAM83C n=1 Tax=Pygocentrus nattereri TaxID=42514 RepID=UPI0008142ABD|nr:protein FAM83C [Pygocentrus nattereri]